MTRYIGRGARKAVLPGGAEARGGVSRVGPGGQGPGGQEARDPGVAGDDGIVSCSSFQCTSSTCWISADSIKFLRRVQLIRTELEK